MGEVSQEVPIKSNISLEELVMLTKDFVKLADSLYTEGRLTKEEYNELTFLKKDFLKKVELNEIN